MFRAHPWMGPVSPNTENVSRIGLTSRLPIYVNYSTPAYLSPLVEACSSCPVLCYGVVERQEMCIITIVGALHNEIAIQFRDLLTNHCSGRQHILICMQDVLRMDDVCVAMLFDAYDDSQKRGRQLMLVAANENVESAVNSDHEKRIPVYRNLLDARQMINRSRLKQVKKLTVYAATQTAF